MADHDSRERFLALGEAVIGAYAYIASLLEDLPIPVIIPDIVQVAEEGGDLADVLLALNRVRAVVEDEPISEYHRRAFEHMLLDWFAAYEIITLVRVAGPAPWRLDVVEFALNRLVTWAEVIENDEQDDDES
ncbi:hypothetical protein [Streptomyces roseochromogenus]|uniref:Uncharacterized protein n=1 Tax=Streptomyces roseochromogenus subsp. oscitans DS 12.976 TaxID=1352936 RepID=V6K5Y0_STRRC|nr:hypothetical protein [Streptomyces roseochromogenus]EST24369.1 hypothetical protein M878_30615 [Streptomyces roseochromogenus subsp. oscitans DS 12.976]